MDKLKSPKADKLTKDENSAIGAARDMVAQLKAQAANGQIDGAILDQLSAILDVTVDTPPDAQAAMESEAGEVEPVEEAPEPTTPIPDAEEVATSEETDAEPEGTEESPQEEPDMDEKVKKNEPAPADSRQPRRGPELMFDHVDEYEALVPQFTKHLLESNLRKAQQLAGDTTGFTTLFNMSMSKMLTAGGWKFQNLSKIQSDMSAGLNTPDIADLRKSMTAASVPGIYLIRLAKLMLPVYAGLTNRIPADSPKTGSDQSTWKAQLGFGSVSEMDFFRIAEASIGVQPEDNFLTFNAPFKDMSVNDSVTLKALRASAGYSDPLQIAVIRAMSLLIRNQERVLVGGNRAAIAAPGTLTLTAGSGGALSSGSMVFAVTALTYEGWVGQTASGSTAYGQSTASNSAVQNVSASATMTLEWAAVPGAVAYNVYVTAAGTTAGSAAKYNKTVLINKAVVTADSTSTVTPPAADTTVNAYGMEGLLAWAEKSTVLGQAITGKITPYDNAGAGLTVANGGISQFDEILADLWVNWQTCPSLMVMSPLQSASLVGKLQSLGSGSFYRVDVTNERNTMNGGLMVTGYVNKFAPFADGTPRMIDIIPHPYFPDGTVLFLSESIPYPMANETRAFVRDVLLPYTYFPLPSQTAGVSKIQYNFSIVESETLECFNPSVQTALVGVDKDL